VNPAGDGFDRSESIPADTGADASWYRNVAEVCYFNVQRAELLKQPTLA